MLNKLMAMLTGDKKKTRQVMIVDDENEIRELLSTYLADMNCSINKASNCEEALELLERDNRYRLVIADLMMPGGSGLKLLKSLRKSPATSRMPVIIMSGNVPASKMAEIKREYARVEVMQKPFKMKQFQTMVESAFKSGFADSAPA